MINRTFITVGVFAASIILGCKRKEIVLGNVSDLPEEFYQDKHFGTSLKSINQLNKFMLVTGGVNKFGSAVIAVDKKNVYLNLTNSNVAANEESEHYSGNG
jgi:hypothetical protein